MPERRVLTKDEQGIIGATWKSTASATDDH